MKTYPTIPGKPVPSVDIIAFDKLDGSNIRAEWSRKKGFYKFGKRHGLLDDETPFLTQAQPLFLEKYGEDMERVYRAQRWDRAVCFFEFWGPSSAFGWHADEEHTVTLFDVNPHKKGILPPREFLRLFGHLDHAAVLYEGKANQDLRRAVNEGTLPGMTFEGVVCKGAPLKKKPIPVMFKIKNHAWYQALRDRVWQMAEDEAAANRLFDRLA